MASVVEPRMSYCGVCGSCLMVLSKRPLLPSLEPVRQMCSPCRIVYDVPLWREVTDVVLRSELMDQS